VLLRDEALELQKFTYRYPHDGGRILEHDLAAMDVVTESEAAKREPPLALPEGNSLQFLDVMGSAPVMRIAREGASTARSRRPRNSGWRLLRDRARRSKRGVVRTEKGGVMIWSDA
jgi:hypothetical protein